MRNLLRLFGTRFATVQLFKDGMVEMPAADGAAGIESSGEHFPRQLNEDTVGGQAMVLKRVVQISPLIGNPLAPAAAQQMGREFGYNSIIAAPMTRQDKVIGAVVCCASRAAGLHRERSRARKGLRQPSGDRHRERPIV